MFRSMPLISSASASATGLLSSQNENLVLVVPACGADDAVPEVAGANPQTIHLAKYGSGLCQVRPTLVTFLQRERERRSYNECSQVQTRYLDDLQVDRFDICDSFS